LIAKQAALVKLYLANWVNLETTSARVSQEPVMTTTNVLLILAMQKLENVYILQSNLMNALSAMKSAKKREDVKENVFQEKIANLQPVLMMLTPKNHLANILLIHHLQDVDQLLLALTALHLTLANLQIALMDNVSKLSIPVMTRNLVPRILVICKPENASTHIPFLKNAHLMEHVKRILIARNGLLSLNLMFASLLSVTLIPDLANLFLTMLNAALLLVIRNALQKTNAQDHTADMTNPPSILFANTEETLAMITTNVLETLAIMKRDASTHLTKLSLDAEIQFAKIKLIANLGL
jgi:hypothetical protein